MRNMAGKRNIKNTVGRLIKGKRIRIPMLTPLEKEELKDRIKFAIRQMQSGKV